MIFIKKDISISAIEQASEILNQVAAGSLPPNEALETWPLPISGVDRIFIDAWVRLQHFADDMDILAVDGDYRASQVRELREIASRILAAGRGSR